MKDRFAREIKEGDIVMTFSAKGIEGYGMVCESGYNIKVFQHRGSTGTFRKLSSYLVIVLEGSQIDYVTENCYPFKVSQYVNRPRTNFEYFLKEYDAYMNGPK